MSKKNLDADMQTLYEKAVQVCVEYDRASASLLQRRLKIGYAQASRILDLLEKDRIVSKAVGAEPREVLINNNNKRIEYVKKPLRWFLFKVSEAIEELAYRL